MLDCLHLFSYVQIKCYSEKFILVPVPMKNSWTQGWSLARDNLKWGAKLSAYGVMSSSPLGSPQVWKCGGGRTVVANGRSSAVKYLDPGGGALCTRWGSAKLNGVEWCYVGPDPGTQGLIWPVDWPQATYLAYGVKSLSMTDIGVAMCMLYYGFFPFFWASVFATWDQEGVFFHLAPAATHQCSHVSGLFLFFCFFHLSQ